MDSAMELDDEDMTSNARLASVESRKKEREGKDV